MSGATAIVAALAAMSDTTQRVHDRWRARWRLRNHVPLDDDAREGDLVYVAGIVRPLEETLVAPLSGRPCVAYRSRARGSATRNGSTYNTLWQETMQLRPFAVDCDDGGTIIVEGDRAVLAVTPQKLVPRNPEREQSFRARHALSKGRATFSEVVVEVGAPVYVGGTLVLVPPDEPPTDGELGFRDLAPLDAQLVGNRNLPLVIVTRAS